MSRFNYAVVSSVLHDEEAVEAIFSAYLPLFRGLEGQRVELTGSDAQIPPLFFILTGGTEGIVLDFLSSAPSSPSGKAFPLVLLAHPHHNSLPAALEIAARAGQEGRAAIVIQLRSPDDVQARREIIEASELCSAIAAMRRSRIGAVGEPSDWLVASSQKAEAVASAWGPRLESVAFQELTDAIGAIRVEGNLAQGKEFKAFLEGSRFVREPKETDMGKSDSIYRALRRVVEEKRLDALTLRCFDLVLLDRSTGCYALSQLADDGIDAGCEGDIPSIIALRWMRLLTGKAAWMANPSEIRQGVSGEKGSILLAHCTVPRSLLASYGIRSHFESGLGLAVAGAFDPGPVTLVRIGGAALDKAWIAEGFLSNGAADEGLCRTQALIELENKDIARLLGQPLGNHLVVGFGHWAKKARRYLAMERIEEI